MNAIVDAEEALTRMQSLQAASPRIRLGHGNADGSRTLAVYRIKSDGHLHRLKRWPAALD